MTATQKARALLAQYHAAKATYESPDPHDREERRYDNMNAARSRVEDVALVEALLAEREWQPIDTAPDGWFLALQNSAVYKASRCNDGLIRAEKVRVLSDAHPVSESGAVLAPTHWQPLPTPPDTDTQQRESAEGGE